MSKADKKQRHKAKREAKRKAHRRREAVSPVKRLAEAPGEPACWMTEDFEGFGQAQLFAWKQGGGLSGLAAFLIDEGVVGLKDAWTRMEMDHAQLEEVLEEVKRSGFALRRIEPEAMRHWIASAARWAHENGMVLPKDWLKTASLIGGVGDWKSADISAFKKEFTGHLEDLRQRLIGEPFETYIRRRDVEFIFSDEAPYMDQRTGEYVDSDDPDDVRMEGLPKKEIVEFTRMIDGLADVLIQKTRDWLVQRGQTPSPDLDKVWRMIVTTKMLGVAQSSQTSMMEFENFAGGLVEQLRRQMEPDQLEMFDQASEQIMAHQEADMDSINKVVADYADTISAGVRRSLTTNTRP